MSNLLSDRVALVTGAARGIAPVVLLAVGLCVPSLADAQTRSAGAWGNSWTSVPTVMILTQGNDNRVTLVREAVAFWNQTFAGLGSPFRLGSVTTASGAIASAELAALSEKVRSRTGPAVLSTNVSRWPGHIVVVLSDGAFVSFAARWPERQKALVAIRNAQGFPLALPNVARNVIAHELGHAIGLGHNGDPTKLMCGRPAPCRPDAFAAKTSHYFPLTSDEKAALKRMYPADWKAQ